MSVSTVLSDITNIINHFDKNLNLSYFNSHSETLNSYATIIDKKLEINFDSEKYELISIIHDLFKSDNDLIKYLGIDNIIYYVRNNMKTLEEWGLDDYFNSDIQWHPLASMIFLINHYKLKDPEIIWPIVFHSCPIIPIYETLDNKIQNLIDIIILSDKLSSNYIKINTKEKRVYFDLDQIIFGNNGKEFNFSLGLYLARLIAQGKSTNKYSLEATKYYHQRLIDINPTISNTFTLKNLNRIKLWPKRNSQVLKMP